MPIKMNLLADKLFAWRNTLTPLFMAVLLILISHYNYLLFHVSAEFFAIGVAWAMLTVMWHCYGYTRHHLLMYLSIGYFWLAGIDLLHTVTYKGMGIFPATDTDANLSTQLWISARFLEALFLLSAPLFIRRSVNRSWLFLGLGIVTLFVLWTISHGWFPDCYIEGQGLTPFKIYTEYFIILLLFIVWLHFYVYRKKLDTEIFMALGLVLLFSAISELAFSFYISVYGLSNLVGHIFKIFSLWVVYLSIIRYPLQQIVTSAQEQKSNAEQLRVSEAHFRAIANYSYDMEVWTMPDAQVAWVNPSVERFTGYKPEEYMHLQDRFSKVIAKEDRERMFKLHCRALQEHISANDIPFRMCHKNGSQRWVAVSFQPIYDQDKIYQGLRSSIRDIQERIEAEQHFHTLASNIAGVNYRCACDKNWTMAFINEGIETLTGYPAADFIANQVRSYASVIHPDDVGMVEERVLQSVAEQRPFTIEYRIIHADQTIRWVHEKGVSVLNEQSNTRYLDGVIDDISERKQAEQALRDSKHQLAEVEARQRLILNTVGEGIYGIDEKGLCTFINPAALEMLGYRDTAEVLGRDMHKLIHHFDANGQPLLKKDCPVHQTLHNDWVSREDQIFTRVDGSCFPVWVHARQIKHEQQIIGAVVSFRNVSIHKEMEEALRAERNFAESVINTAPAIVLLIDTKGRIIRFNSYMENISGYCLEEVQGKDWFRTFLPESDQEQIRNIFLNAIGEIQTKGNVNPIVTKEGKEVEIEWWDQTLKDTGGKVVGLLAIGQDITERLQAERSLRLSEKRFRELVENMSDMVYQFSNTQGSLYWSPRVATSLGYTPTEIMNNPMIWHDAIHPEDIIKVDAAIAESIKGHSFAIKYRIKDRHGDWHWLHDRAIGRESRGKEVIISGIAQDITEQVKAEQALQEAKEKLEQRVAERTEELELTNHALVQAKEIAESANRAKSLFLANMSHELRTPLNAILGFSQLMVNAPDTTLKQKESLDIINHAGEHLLAMINDVLDLSKIEANKIELHLEIFDVKQLLQDMTEMFRIRAQSKNISIKLMLEDNMSHHIKTDPGKLRQIISNLLGNAIKFTPQGNIDLRAGLLPPAYETEQWYLQVAVQDTGKGIAKGKLDDIFKPFVQAAPDMPGQKGTGLGLTISRKFVELLGGEMRVTSTLGEGTYFSFLIAVDVPETAAEITQKNKAMSVLGLQPRQQAWRILVVDDDQDSCTLLKNVLTEVGFEVKTGVNGEDAVRLFQTWQPHFIWLDIQMPVMDGYAATAKIRALSGGEQVKIVALTANVFQKERNKVLLEGCDDILAKPFLIPQVFELMNKYLGVSYIYAQEAVTYPPQKTAALSVDDLKKLSKALLNLLYEAILTLEAEQIDNIVAQIREINPDIAKRLEILTKVYDYEPIYILCTQILTSEEKLN
ncbi:PAS domain S-box protein [Candidatus Venteria ishoeyi]|uniref:PAS domain S-box protein n=1 Tax=Candidatus Venteria ishoeyi TaxID=1899563 RepID=UPI0025A5CBCB|nr:PAS domain S-box protein [Candidatus Venteria ishoeyi]MDM8546861.1 PAS domain S-box protein [Candidatus Venteria ishoeyi]